MSELKPTILVWFAFLAVTQAKELKFPVGFKLGVSTASYQIEGGWNASGKGENIWDSLTHRHPNLISDGSTGDVACDSYHQWQTDVKNLDELKVDHYRLSLSWTRILPNGYANHINKDGVAYYNKLIDLLISKGIEPIVTIYHWDLPHVFQTVLGGWTNPELAIYFEDYARVVFGLFGDRVKTWITINEPASICVDTYEYDNGAPPFVKSPGIGLYLCGKTILLAHARAYRLYDSEFRTRQNGKIGITIDSIWAEPKSNQSKDIDAASREMQFGLGWWAHPIFAGDYPEIMKARIANNSKLENFTQSRLPQLSRKQVKLIQGSWDFLGLNHYNTWLIEDQDFPNGLSSFQKDKGTKGTKPSPSMVPWGFRKLLNWVKNEYNNPLVIVTENGFGDGGGVHDNKRVLFLREFMTALLLAVLEDGCNIKGYTVWSLMDNMEWRSGYTIKFGLYDVNFTDPLRTRTPKMSADYYKEVLRTRTIPEIRGGLREAIRGRI